MFAVATEPSLRASTMATEALPLSSRQDSVCLLAQATPPEDFHESFCFRFPENCPCRSDLLISDQTESSFYDHHEVIKSVSL